MAAYIWCEILCAHCNELFHGRFTNRAIPRNELVAEAVRKGAIKRGDDYFCGQTCQDAYDEQTKKQKEDGR